MAARTRKVSIDDRTKLRIQTTQLVKRLEGHVLGQVDMKPTQVTAALGLLKKSLPDLSAVEAKHDVSDALSDVLKAVNGSTRGLPPRS